MVQAYRTDDPWGGVARGYSLGNALRGDVARSRAGSALAADDYTGGANALLMNGDVEAGLRVQDYGARQKASAAAAEKAAEEEALKFTTEIAGRLAEVHRSSKDLNATLAAFDQVVPQLQKYDSPEEIAQLRQRIATDPDNTLLMLGAGAAKQLGYDVRNAGDEVLVIDKGTGQLVSRYRGARTVNLPEGGALYELPGTDGPISEAPAEETSAPTAPTASGGTDPAQNVRAVVDRLVSSGARITSGRRSAADNARVGGAKNSYHLTGHAYDIVPPPGMSMADLERELRSTGVDFAELINEGDHIHIAWDRDEEPAQPYQVAANGDTPAPPSGARLIAQRPKAPREQWVDLPGGGQRNVVTGKVEGVPRSSGKLSAAALNQQNEHLGALQASSAMNTKLDKVKGLLDSGKLDLGIAKNIVARGQNAIGLSSEASRNFASFRADLEKIRNDSLRLNKGVQTEGDAQRAWNELLTNLNDPEVVRQRLEEIEAYNRQAIAFHQDMVTQIREDSGMAPIDTTRFMAKPLPQGGVRDVRTPAEARALPPGTRFRTPDGQIRVRQ